MNIKEELFKLRDRLLARGDIEEIKKTRRERKNKKRKNKIFLMIL